MYRGLSLCETAQVVGNMKKRHIYVILFLIAVCFFYAIGAIKISATTHKHHEAYYQNQWCAERNGQVEVVLPDKTRCDCLTDFHAVEVDFATKWAEAIGQSLYYSTQTGKPPGILLIIRNEKDQKYTGRINAVIEYYNLPITVWTINE